MYHDFIIYYIYSRCEKRVVVRPRRFGVHRHGRGCCCCCSRDGSGGVRRDAVRRRLLVSVHGIRKKLFGLTEHFFQTLGRV